AGAMLFLAVVLFDRSRAQKVLAIALGVAAVFIHSSAVIAIALYVFARFFRFRVRSIALLSLATLASGAALAQISVIRDTLGSLNERYVGYLDNVDGAGLGTYL